MLGGEGEDREEQGEGVEAPLVDAGGVSSVGEVEDEIGDGDVYLDVDVEGKRGVGVEDAVPETLSITGFVWAEPYTEKYTSSGLGLL